MKDGIRTDIADNARVRNHHLGAEDHHTFEPGVVARARWGAL
ncbi:hypothetical protein [Streptomyces xantholiticus]|nr:hypothetical protein [Streptomyces xantholiticus]GGW57540.1 hypothetical protein GCM10010381_48480 [Streptomyces xantholiticus]